MSVSTPRRVRTPPPVHVGSECGHVSLFSGPRDKFCREGLEAAKTWVNQNSL